MRSKLISRNTASEKVRNHDAAMSLGWWHACVWVTDDRTVAERLRRSVTERGATRAGHYTAHTGDVGVAGAGERVVPSSWGWARAA